MKDVLRIREKLFFDIAIVGAGIAGLSAGIKLKQLDPNLEICILEKALNVGDHVLSGCVFNPRALYELFPNWENMQSPIITKVSKVQNVYLTSTQAYNIPFYFTPWSNYNGHYVISLSQLCKWLKTIADDMKIRVFEGFSAKELLINNFGYIEGVATGPVGLKKNYEKTEGFQDSFEILAKQTIFAEGAHGYLTELVINRYKLNEFRNITHEIESQTYSLGLKEVWKVPFLDSGKIINTYNWPLGKSRSKGFLYYCKDFLHIGLNVGLDYSNPYTNIYKEFQLLKTHPSIQKLLKGGECIEFGGKLLEDGGVFSVPKLSFKGGMIVGSAGGLSNPMTSQGAHTAMKSGMLAAEAIYEKMKQGNITGIEIGEYYLNYQKSWIFDELFKYRNIRQSFNRSPAFGLFYSAMTKNNLIKPTFLIEVYKKGDTLPENEITGYLSDHKEIKYPEEVLGFDPESSLVRSKNIWKDQPEFIELKNGREKDALYSVEIFGGIEEKICPTGVFKYKEKLLEIDSKKCIMCGACKIKSTRYMIDWKIPEAGTGPQ